MLGDPVLVDGRALRLAGFRREHALGKLGTTMPLQWAHLMGVSPIKGQLSEVGYGVREDVVGADTIGYTVAVEVASLAALPPALTCFDIPPARYAVFDGFTRVGDLRRAWEPLMDQWLPKSGLQLATTPSFERYGEDFDPLLGGGSMAIWLAILG